MPTIEKHCPQFEYSISMVVIDAFNPAVPELLRTLYLLSTISRRVYIVQRVGWQRWKIIERIIVIIPVASRVMAICWRLCGLPASTKESVVPPILAPTFCTMANSLLLLLRWLVCKLLTGCCSCRDGIKLKLWIRILKVRIFGWLYLIVYAVERLERWKYLCLSKIES